MGFVVNEVEVVGGDGEDGAKVEAGCPLVVEGVELGEVVGGDGVLEVAAPEGDAAQEGGNGCLEVDHKVRWREEGGEDFVEVAVGGPISLGHVALRVEVAGEDLGVFVDAAVLDDGAGAVEEGAVVAQAAGEEEDLRVEAPTLHVGVKVGEVGVFNDGLVERLPAKLLGKQPGEAGLAYAYVSGHRYKVFHGLERQVQDLIHEVLKRACISNELQVTNTLSNRDLHGSGENNTGKRDASLLTPGCLRK